MKTFFVVLGLALSMLWFAYCLRLISTFTG